MIVVSHMGDGGLEEPGCVGACVMFLQPGCVGARVMFGWWTISLSSAHLLQWYVVGVIVQVSWGSAAAVNCWMEGGGEWDMSWDVVDCLTC